MHEIMAQRKYREAHDVAERWQRTAAMWQQHLLINVLMVGAPVVRLKALRLNRCVAIIERPVDLAGTAPNAYIVMVHVLLEAHLLGTIIPITSKFVPDSCEIIRDNQGLPSVIGSLPILFGGW